MRASNTKYFEFVVMSLFCIFLSFVVNLYAKELFAATTAEVLACPLWACARFGRPLLTVNRPTRPRAKTIINACSNCEYSGSRDVMSEIAIE